MSVAERVTGFVFGRQLKGSNELERTFNMQRNKVIGAAFDVMSHYDKLHPRFSFFPLDDKKTNVEIVLRDMNISDKDKEMLCGQMFDLLERFLVSKAGRILGTGSTEAIKLTLGEWTQ